MTTPRDTLADLIEAAGTPEAAADAVLANVPGLVWVDNTADLDFPCSYSFDGDDEDGWSVTMCYRECAVYLPEDGALYPSMAAAQSAAETDHRARLAQAMGWA